MYIILITHKAPIKTMSFVLSSAEMFFYQTNSIDTDQTAPVNIVCIYTHISQIMAAKNDFSRHFSSLNQKIENLSDARPFSYAVV